MTYQRHEIHIALECSSTLWWWHIMDSTESGDGEPLTSGNNPDYAIACEQAIAAYDIILRGGK